MIRQNFAAHSANQADIFIDDFIVPENVQRGYLANCSLSFLQEIESVYESYAREQFTRSEKENIGSSEFILIAGTQGVGKTKLAKRLERENNKRYVICDVDTIISRFPGVKEALNHVREDIQAQNFYNTEDHLRAIQKATEKYRNAAKYISDRLMTEAVQEGYPVMVETNAKTPSIKDFLNNIQKTGVALSIHICEAPLKVKVAGARSPDHGVSFSEETIRRDHEAMRKNLPVLANAAKENLSLWWRQDQGPLQPVAIGKSKSFEFINREALAGFEAHFADLPRQITIERLMGLRLEVKPAQARNIGIGVLSSIIT